jgi:hypothetical protein
MLIMWSLGYRKTVKQGCYPGFRVDGNDKCEKHEVDDNKEVLRKENVGAALRGVIQAEKDVDEARGIPVPSGGGDGFNDGGAAWGVLVMRSAATYTRGPVSPLSKV